MRQIDTDPILRVGVLGMGNVGRRVVHELLKAQGNGIELIRVAVLHPDRDRGIQPDYLTDKATDIINDPNINTVVELIGGTDPATDYIMEAIARRKNVVSGNKAVFALHGKKISEAARSAGVAIGIEASVMGPTPVMENLLNIREEGIKEASGVLNGTTGHMLSKMENGWSRPASLDDARRLGYAEADASRDMDGRDTRDKLGFVASVMCNAPIPVEMIKYRGIDEITPDDIQFAKNNGFVIKLLALAKRENGTVELEVTPALIEQTHPLTAARGARNILFINTEVAGDLMFYGPGAGPETASAVLKDLRSIRDGSIYQLPAFNQEVRCIDPAPREMVNTRNGSNPFYLPLFS